MSTNPQTPGIEWKRFGTTREGAPVAEIILTNKQGASASVLTYGAILKDFIVPDAKGHLGNIVLGFDNLGQYENESPYFGATIGRVGNRVAKGLFDVEGKTYAVPINNGSNHLHGGIRGYDKRVWHADSAMSDGPAVRFTLTDPDGTEGYPGTVNVSVIYTLTHDNVLRIQYYATTDATTPINLTNHSYFNLADGGASTIYDHVYQAKASHYIPVDAELIPTGEIAPVAGTPIDFRTAKPLGQDLAAMGGYDHCLAFDDYDGSLRPVIEVSEPTTGRHLEVWTTQPGCQLYTGNFLDGSILGRGGVSYGQHHAFCAETQHFPDAVNQPSFPNSLVKPGEVYRHITEFRF